MLDDDQLKNLINLKSRRFVPYHDQDGINTLEGLDVLCKKYITKDMVVVEMGYHWGVSASLFSQYAKTVHTIDKAALENYLTYRIPNVIFHYGIFKHVLKKIHHIYPEGVDLVYIDGYHSYSAACTDIELALPIIKKTGYIAGHDYYMDDVAQAVTDKLSVKPETFPDTSWLVKIKDLA